MIYPLQIRAARALLDWSQHELAERSSVGLATIKRIEAAGGELAGTAKTLFRIQNALEAAGVVFIDATDEHGPGVRLKRPLA
jgi:transcriptional regulator with XRE-family HTH domain